METAPDLPDVGQPNFSSQELRHVWYFLNGAIMDINTRRALWRSWGLCPRHAWAYTVPEIEVRGGKPFATAILYQDLAGRAASMLKRTMLLPWPLVLGRFRARASCPTCDYGEVESTYHGAHEVSQEQVNSLQRTRTLLFELQPRWLETACPLCLGGRGVVCRHHLLAGAEPVQERAQLADYFSGLSRRLRAYVKSLTADGGQAGTEEEVSWVEALGWFASWRIAQQIGEQHGGN